MAIVRVIRTHLRLEDGRRNSNASKPSKGGNESEVSFVSDGSLPSFFKAQTAGTSQWKLFLQDSESSQSAGRFARVWNFFILTTVFFSLTQAQVEKISPPPNDQSMPSMKMFGWSQALNPPLVSGEIVGFVEAGIETLFCIELFAIALLEPRKMVLTSAAGSHQHGLCQTRSKRNVMSCCPWSPTGSTLQSVSKLRTDVLRTRSVWLLCQALGVQMKHC